MIDRIRQLRQAHESAIECRLRIGQAFIDANTKGDQAAMSRIYPSLEEARESENNCRIALSAARKEMTA